MAEAAPPPLDRALPWALPEGGLDLFEEHGLQQIGLRLRPPFSAYMAGLPLPLEPNRVAAMGAMRSLWLGPDEWLLTAPENATPGLFGRLQRAVGGRRAAVTDLSSSRAVIAVAGERARDLLAAGCGLDLHPRVFAPGQCAQTLFARVPIILDQVGAQPQYRLFVRRSYARWLCAYMIDAAAGLDREG